MTNYSIQELLGFLDESLPKEKQEEMFEHFLEYPFYFSILEGLRLERKTLGSNLAVIQQAVIQKEKAKSRFFKTLESHISK